MNATDEWDRLAGWWADEGRLDPLYEEDIHPWLKRLLESAGEPLLDLGCGEGQTMRYLDGRRVIGVDVTAPLAHRAARAGPVVRARLPHLPWLRSGGVVGAYAVFVLEHLPELGPLFAEVSRVVTPGGVFAVVGNHPAYTAPGAGPLLDDRDGEVLWRWGPYFSLAVSGERVGPGEVTFHHRPLGAILTEAAAAGWVLERFDERGLSQAAVARTPAMAGQEQMPRMYAAVWRNPRTRPENATGGR